MGNSGRVGRGVDAVRVDSVRGIGLGAGGSGVSSAADGNRGRTRNGGVSSAAVVEPVRSGAVGAGIVSAGFSSARTSSSGDLPIGVFTEGSSWQKKFQDVINGDSG